MAKRSPCWRLVVLLFLIALPAYSGCGAGAMEAEVEGTVTWRDRPLSGLYVTFIPESGGAESAARSFGVTDDQGHYVLTCLDGRRGTSAGPHRVLIGDAVVDPGRGMKGKRTAQPLPLPGKGKPRLANPEFPSSLYGKAETTPLRQDVATGKQTIDFHLPEHYSGN